MVANIESTTTPNQVLKWKFELKNRSFQFDPLLLPFLGYPESKKLSLAQFFNCFDEAQTKEITSAFKHVLATKERFERSTLINGVENRYLVNLSIYFTESNGGLVEGDIEYLRAFPSIDLENTFFRKIFINSETGRMLATSDHTIISVNKVFCKELGYQPHELVGQHARILKSGYYEPEFYKKLWETVDTAKVWRGELLAIDNKKEVYAREVKIERFELDDGDHFYFTNSIQLDVASALLGEQVASDIKNANLPDKAKYTESLLKCYEEMSTEKTIVVATFSISWMQKISDFTACWLIAQRFQLARNSGTLGLISKGIYSLYWIEDKNPDKIDTLLRKLLTTYSHGFDDSGFDFFSTVSIGVSILGVDAKNPTQLISHSTQTLIANPSGEHSSLYYFDRRLATRFDRHHVLSTLLKKALTEKAVDVYYQPIVEIPSLKIKEFEALCRIHLDTDIDYDTQELINIAETHNWIDDVDEMVTQKALEALPKIQKHYQSADIAMAINRSLANDRVSHCCLEDTINILLASKVNLKNITIELTESAIFENFEEQKQWVEELQKHGVKIAIDDFGTGYSSFAYLNNLPVNFIKIDRSFVTGITLDSNEYAMVEMLCKLAHKIGAKVIAEGVETSDDLALLSRAKVDFLQGYLFSRPVSLETILSTPPKPFSQALLNILQHDQASTLYDICVKDFIAAASDNRLSMLKKQFDSNEEKFCIIIDNKKCSGVLYRDDYYAATSPYIGTKGEQKRDLLTLERRMHQVMDKEFYCLHVDSDIDLAEQYFADNPYSVIIIVNHNNNCIGITTAQTLMRYHYSEKIKNNGLVEP